jgi:hypothetical protein
MTIRSALDELIARLEAASEGTTELSAEIERDVAGRRVHQWPFWFRVTSFDGHENSAVVPVTPYTTSLDAAATLVPEGWDWGVSVNHRDHLDRPLVYAMCGDVRDGISSAEKGHCRIEAATTSAPIALCIVALGARRQAVERAAAGARDA